MEDYDKFVQHRLSYWKKSEEDVNKSSAASSVIRVHGRPILPPLLSAERREEMQRDRDAAQRAAEHRTLNADRRMACVQTILQSVQLRKTPTLEELLQEFDINTKSSYSNNSSGGSVLQNSYVIGTKDSLVLPPPLERKEKDAVSLLPLTSTTYSAFYASSETPQQSYPDGCLTDQHCSQQGSQPSSLNGASQQSVTSGYVTFENVENTSSISREIDAGRESLGFISSEGAYHTSGFFLHNTSNTIAKMPDIISHPPIDGEELERSGLESSFNNDFVVVNDICCSSLQESSVMCEHLPIEKGESSHVESTEGEDSLSVPMIHDLDKEHSLDGAEGPVSSLENSDFSQTFSTHLCPTAEPNIQPDPTETEPADSCLDEAKPCEQPYRLSLQALLKKSQEYRRRQRMLRNQAKNAKIQEKTQEQARARTEEQSLSDKENDEFSYKGTEEGKKTKERRGTLIPPTKKSWENERMIESELFEKKKNFKSERTHSTGDRNKNETTTAEEETTLGNNKFNNSQELKEINDFTPGQSMSTETSPGSLTTVPSGFHKGLRKYQSIQAPSFCRTPVCCQRKGKVTRQEVNEANISQRINVCSDQNPKIDKVSINHQNVHATIPSSVNLMGDSEVRGSQQIDQLESTLISDLESTLTENLRNQSWNNMRSELSFEGINHSEQAKNEQHIHLCPTDYWEDKLRDGPHNSDAEQHQSDQPRRKSSDTLKNMPEDASEPSICDSSEVEGSEVVNLSELRLLKALAAERATENVTCKEELPKTYGQHGGCRKHLSVAQWLRIPDIFRNVPSETTAVHNVSVLSDASNHSLETAREAALEGHKSAHMPSLNQSYDVNAPSGLWFLESSGSDSGSRGHLVQKKHLTPESDDEGQGGLSKVKRRLLMNVTDEMEEKSLDASRGARSMIRPKSSTPQAAVRWQESPCSQKEIQEQLKQAHAAQVRALQEEHRRQQEELLQALAARYSLLQSVSFPCSMSDSRLGDTLTFSTISQPFSPSSEHYRPLLSAVVKGFLTRRLLRTERVAQLVRTIRDTRHFLQALQQHSPSRGDLHSRQDLLLQERVTLQLRAARYEVYDTFFSLSAGEKMQLISRDRALAQERKHRRQSGHTGQPRGRSSLSAATQKALERKRGMMIQKKAAERHRGAATSTGHITGSSAEPLPQTKRGQFPANPQRVPKST